MAGSGWWQSKSLGLEVMSVIGVVCRIKCGKLCYVAAVAVNSVSSLYSAVIKNDRGWFIPSRVYRPFVAVLST